MTPDQVEREPSDKSTTKLVFERAQGPVALPAGLASIHSASLNLFDEPSHFRPAARLLWGDPLLWFGHPLTQPEFQRKCKVRLVY